MFRRELLKMTKLRKDETKNKRVEKGKF